jgi:hypothetical protein
MALPRAQVNVRVNATAPAGDAAASAVRQFYLHMLPLDESSDEPLFRALAWVSVAIVPLLQWQPRCLRQPCSCTKPRPYHSMIGLRWSHRGRAQRVACSWARARAHNNAVSTPQAGPSHSART